MYSFSPTTAFETSLCARLNTRSANAATVHTPPIMYFFFVLISYKPKNNNEFFPGLTDDTG